MTSSTMTYSTATTSITSSTATMTSSTATTSTEPNKFLELWINNLLCFRQNRNQIFGFGSILWCEESVAGTSISFSSSTTDSMNVVLAVVGVIIIDDKLDIIHVQASSSNIGGNKNCCAARLELSQNPISLLLLLISMNTHSRPSIFSH